jgi:hypothetical protein
VSCRVVPAPNQNVNQRSALIALAIAVVALLVWTTNHTGVRRSTVHRRGATERQAADPETEPLETNGLGAGSERSTEKSESSFPKAANAPTDPRGELIFSLDRVEVPPGSIEGVVLRGESRLTWGGHVFCLRHLDKDADRHDDARIDERSSSPDFVQEVSIDQTGMFRFDHLTDHEYDLVIDVPRNARRWTKVGLYPGHATSRLVVLLGSGDIRGRVFDKHGRPMAGIEVDCSQWTTNIWANRMHSYSVTNADGAYICTGLARGRFSLSLPTRQFTNDPDGNGQRITIDLETDQHGSVDFGSPRGTATWHGCIRTQTGEAFQNQLELLLSDVDRDTTTSWTLSTPGPFEIPLLPGEYRVSFHFPRESGPWREIGTIAVDGPDLEKDLMIPGARVVGTLLRAVAGERVPAHPLIIGIHPNRDYVSSEARTATVAANGEFIFDAIADGEWKLTTEEWEPLNTFSVRKGESEVRVGPVTLVR